MKFDTIKLDIKADVLSLAPKDEPALLYDVAVNVAHSST